MGKGFDNVLGILKARQIAFDPEETRVRADIFLDALRGKPGALKRLREFGRSKQAGGAAGFPKLDLPAVPITVERTPGDYLGTEARWFIKAAGSPYLQALVRISFAVIFFLSYVEAIPIAGSLISASLDIALSGGRVLIKQLQGLGPRLAFEFERHQRGGRLADGATHSGKADVLHRAVRPKTHMQLDLISAGGVVAMNVHGLPLEQAVISGALGVVEDHLLVEFFEI